MGRCPPGVICIENVTIAMIVIIFAIIILFFYVQGKINHPNTTNSSEKIIIREETPQNKGLFPRPSFSFSNIANDVLMNPYTPPLKDDNYIPSGSSDPRGIPINISTRGVARNTPYRQIGLLTRINGPETILSLMGRPLYSNRNKWQYYTMSDKQNGIKLPVTSKGRSCTSEFGCDDLYNGDTVYVEGYNDAFKVTMYDNNTLEYIPYL
jgi:hypothetical protein